MSGKRVVILGAGIVGLSSAYYLRKKGFKVTVLDAGDGTQNCSVGNAGFFCPSHVIPLASPGIITQGLKWMLNEKSPFYVKPRLNADLISWGLKFKKASTRARVEKAAPILHALTTTSQSLAEEMIREEGMEVGYSRSGLLMACKSQKSLDHEIEAAKVAASFGQEMAVLNKEEAEMLNPGLEVNMAGAVYFPNDTLISPHFFLKKLHQCLIEKGVEFHFHSKATNITYSKKEIISIDTPDQSFTADEFVIATGSTTGSLLKPLGLSLPMQGGKGYSFSLPSPPVSPKTPIIFVDGKVSMSPMLDGLRFSGTMEIDGHNPRINPKRIEGIVETILDFLPQFKKEDFDTINPWSGFRPCSPDGLPYLGRSHTYSNMTVATGHAMLGLTLGPVSGQIISDILTDDALVADISLLDVDRYS